MKQRLERVRAERVSVSLEERYRNDARVRVREYTGYRHVPACASCDLRAVCDGFYGDYVKLCRH
jgi:hypothetical protein